MVSEGVPAGAIGDECDVVVVPGTETAYGALVVGPAAGHDVVDVRSSILYDSGDGDVVGSDVV